MPADMILNIRGVMNDFKVDSGAVSKLNNLMKRLGGKARFKSEVKLGIDASALKQLETKSNKVFKSASAGAKTFGKAVTDSTKSGAFNKLIQDAKSLDHVIESLTSQQNRFKKTISDDVKAVGGIKAFKQLEAQNDINIRKAIKLRQEVEKAINAQMKGGVGSTKFQELGIPKAQRSANMAGMRAKGAENKLNALLSKRIGLQKQLTGLQAQSAKIESIPVGKRSVTEKHKLLQIQKKTIAAESHLLNSVHAVTAAEKAHAAALTQVLEKEKLVADKVAQLAPAEQKNNAATQQQIELRKQLKRLMAEEVLRLIKIQQKQKEIALATGQSFSAKSQQQIRSDVRSTAGAGAVSGASVDKQRASIDALANSSRKTAAEEKRLAASMKQVQAASMTSEQAIRAHGTAMQKFGMQARLAIKRYAAYLLPTTGLFMVIGAIRQSITAFVELEAEQTKLEQILKRPQAEVDNLIKGFQRLAIETGVSVSEVANSARVLAQAGFGRGANGLRDLSEAAEQITKTQLAATFGSVESTTDGLIAAINQFNLEISDTGRILDVVNQISKDFAVESQDIFDGIKKGGATFSTLGGTVEEFTVMMGLLRDKTRESASVLGTFFKTGGLRLFSAKAQEALEGLDSSILATKTLPQRLNALAQTFGTLDGESKAYYASQLVGIRQAARLIGILDGIKDGADEAADSMAKATGSLESDVASKLDDVATQFKQLKETINEAVKGFLDNETMNSVVRGFATMAGGIASVMSTLAPILAPMATFGVMFGGLSLMRNVISPSSKNIELKNNTVKIVENTAALNRLSGVTSTGSGSAVFKNRSTIASRRTPFVQHRQSTIRQRAAQLRAANPSMSTTQSLIASRSNLPISARSRMAYGAGGVLVGAGNTARRMGSGIGRRFTRMKRNARLTLAGRRPLGAGAGMGLAMASSMLGGAISSGADLTTTGGKTRYIGGGLLSGGGMGAATGAMIGGPVGAVIGGIVGAGASLIKTLSDINAAEKERMDILSKASKDRFIKDGGAYTDPQDPTTVIAPFANDPKFKRSAPGYSNFITRKGASQSHLQNARDRIAIGQNTVIPLMDEGQTQVAGRADVDLLITGILERLDITKGGTEAERLKAAKEFSLTTARKKGKEFTPDEKSDLARTLQQQAVDIDTAGRELSQAISRRAIALARTGLDEDQAIAQAIKGASEVEFLGGKIDEQTAKEIATIFGGISSSGGVLALAFAKFTAILDDQIANLRSVDIPTEGLLVRTNEALAKAIEKAQSSFADSESVLAAFAGNLEPILLPLVKETESFEDAMNAMNRQLGSSFMDSRMHGILRAGGEDSDAATMSTRAFRLTSGQMQLTPGGSAVGQEFVTDILSRESRANTIGDLVQQIQAGGAGTSNLQSIFSKLIAQATDVEEQLKVTGEEGEGRLRKELNEAIETQLIQLKKSAEDLGLDKSFDVLFETIREGGLSFEQFAEVFTSDEPVRLAEGFLGVTKSTQGVIELTNQLLEMSNFHAEKTIQSMKQIQALDAQIRSSQVSSAQSMIASEDARLQRLIEFGSLDKKVNIQRLRAGESLTSGVLGLRNAFGVKQGSPRMGALASSYDIRRGDLAFNQAQSSKEVLARGQVVTNVVAQLMQASGGTLTPTEALTSILKKDQTGKLTDSSTKIRDDFLAVLKETGITTTRVDAPGGLLDLQTRIQTLFDDSSRRVELLKAGFDEFFIASTENTKRLMSVFNEDLVKVMSIGEKFLRLDDNKARGEELTKLQNTQDSARKAMDIITNAGITSTSGGSVRGSDLNSAEIAQNAGLLNLGSVIGGAIGDEGVKQILDAAQSEFGDMELKGTQTTFKELAQLLTQSIATKPANALGVKIGSSARGGMPDAAAFKTLGNEIKNGFALIQGITASQENIASGTRDYLEAQKEVIAAQTILLKDAAESIPETMSVEIKDFNIKVDLTGVLEFTTQFQSAFLGSLQLGTLIDQKIKDAMDGRTP